MSDKTWKCAACGESFAPVTSDYHQMREQHAQMAKFVRALSYVIDNNTEVPIGWLWVEMADKGLTKDGELADWLKEE